jgi:hypothetical protein
MPPKTFLEGKANAAQKQNRSAAKEEIKMLIKKYIPSFDLIVNKLPPATKKGMKALYDDFYNEILKDIEAVDNKQQDEAFVVKQLQNLLIRLFPENNLFQNQLETKSEKEREVKIQASITPEINVSEGMASKVFGVTESKQSTIPQITNSKIAIQKKFQPEIIPTLAEIKSTESKQSTIPLNENKKITLSDLLEAESANLVPKRKKEKKQQTASLVDEKEREVKLPQQEQPITTGQSTTSSRLLQTMSKLPVGGLLGLASSYAIRTNNKDLSRFITPLFAALGDVVYRSISEMPYGIKDILKKIKELGVSEDDLIKESKQNPPSKKATRAVKFEQEQKGKHDEPPQPKPIEPDSRASPVDEKNELGNKIPNRQNPSIKQTESEMNNMINEALDKYKNNRNIADLIKEVKDINKLTAEAQSQTVKNIFTRFTDKTLPYEKAIATAILKVVNPSLYNKMFTSDDRLRNIESKTDDIFPPMNQMMNDMKELENNENVFADDLPDAKVTLGDYADSKDYDGDTVPASSIRDRFDRMGNVAKAIGVAGGSKIVADSINSITSNKDIIKEEPISYKQDKSDQNDVPTPAGLIRGAGILKPKFIVPSVNIFAKTEQEQFVDDMEFAMFDFVQDDSGGNDPNGTNYILRDQTISKGLRYQRSGVTVNSLYGRDIPNNPNNISKEMMNQLFLGEPILPTMKFLFSEEFYPQEFNQSEFEVSNYDVNNELTAIEMLSPYANFTNNQLLDQFIDTSILYGIVP